MTNNFRLPQRPLPRPQIPEQIGRDLPHLDLFGALGDAIPPVVPINMLERLVARIADAAMDLHRAIGGFADEAVRPIIAHADLVRQRALRSEEQTSELQSLMRISYAVFCLKKNTTRHN